MAHTVPMGFVIAFLLLALVVSLVVLGVVALPHLRRMREQTALTRHSSRSTRTSS